MGDGVDPGKVIVLGSSVDLERFRHLPQPAVCRTERGLPADRPIVGYVGRFEALGAEKGLLTAVRAVGSMRASSGQAPLLMCVGGPMDHVGEYVAAGVAAGGQPNDFTFVDHVSSAEVPAWIRACDVGVIPSPRTDHFAKYSSPMKLFEFMASGVPVVASNLPALRETLVHGHNAWLVPPDSVDDLAIALGNLLRDDAVRGRLAQQAVADVAAHSWTRRAEAILTRFGPALGGQPSEPL